MNQGKSSSRFFLRSTMVALAACLGAAAHAQVNPAKLTVFWDFNDAATPAIALDSKHGIVGQLTDGAAYTAPGEGRSGSGTDRAVDFGSDGQREKVRVRNVEWLNQIARAG